MLKMKKAFRLALLALILCLSAWQPASAWDDPVLCRSWCAEVLDWCLAEYCSMSPAYCADCYDEYFSCRDAC